MHDYIFFYFLTRDIRWFDDVFQQTCYARSSTMLLDGFIIMITMCPKRRFRMLFRCHRRVHALSSGGHRRVSGEKKREYLNKPSLQTFFWNTLGRQRVRFLTEEPARWRWVSARCSRKGVYQGMNNGTSTTSQSRRVGDASTVLSNGKKLPRISMISPMSERQTLHKES